ncbi:MAG: tetratricopeptide repeat protein [Paracoccaceae bacterium]
MDFLRACFQNADGSWYLADVCGLGLSLLELLSVIALLLSVIIWIWYRTRKAGQIVSKKWSTLTEHKDWPKHSNLAHQPAPKRFVGRSDKISDIQRLLDERKATVVQATITGAGGFGKTTLAIEVARQSQSRFEGVWVIAAASADALQKSFLELARKLGVENVETRPRANVVRDTFDHITASGHPWLLVYDNADQPEVLNDYQIAGDHKIRTLITSRSTNWDGETRITIDKMTAPEALELLQSLLPNRAANDLKNLADRVGFWPLGLVGAAGFLKGHRNTSIADYIADFDITKARLETSDYAKGHPEKLSFAAVLEMTTDQLDKDDKDLLSVLAFLNPDDLWPDGLQEGATHQLTSTAWDEGLPDFWQRAGETPALITQGFDHLSGVSLIEQDDDGWTMHRMTGEIWRDVLGEQAITSGDTAARLINALAPYQADDPNTWGHFQRLLDQGRAMMQVGVQNAAAARFFHQLSTFAMNRWAQASDQDFADASVEINEVLAPNSESLAASLNNQAGFLQDLDNLDAALAVYERVLEMRGGLEDIGPNHPSYAVTLNNIAGVFRAKKQFSKAVELMLQAKSIDEASLGPTHPDTITDFRNLGVYYGAWAQADPDHANIDDLRMKEAEAKQTALDRSLASLGIFHPYTALDFHNSAVRWISSDTEEAFDLMSRGAIARVDILGPDQPTTIRSVQAAFDLGQANDMSAQAVYEALFKTYAQMADEHQHWGVTKIRSMMAATGIDGDISQQTLDALSNSLRQKVTQMRDDGKPIEAWNWVTQEASYAFNARQFEPDPQAFHEKLVAAIENVKAQLTAAPTG